MLTIDPEFESLIPPLSSAELADLEKALIAAGRALDPIKHWRGVIIDGHNRYRICTRLGLPYDTQSVALADRDAAKAWMLTYQRGRRNLTRDKQLALALMHGQEPPLGTTTTERKLMQAAVDAGEGPAVLAGRLTLRMLMVRARPRAPRGPAKVPTTPAVPEAHEIKGVSTLTGPDGEAKAQWTKTGIAGQEPAHDPVPPGHLVTKTATMFRPDGTASVQWVSAEPEKVARWQATCEAVRAFCAEHVRAANAVTAPEVAAADLLTVYPLGDPHIGMLAWAAEVGESFDLRIASAELSTCMRLLVTGAPASERAIITNLGDFFHAQNDKQVTPQSGHKLDVDGRHGKIARVGLDMLIALVDAALAKHRHVTMRNVPGNHDADVAFWIPEVLRRHYANEPRVTIESSHNPYQFDAFGAVALGWCHGDGAKHEALGEIMATDQPALWAASRFRYWHTGHIHHLTRKELRGCVVESHRTLAGRDAWHHHAGYRSGRSLQAITYHREWGEDSRVTVGVERVRAAIARAA